MIEFYSVTGGVPQYIELFTEADNLYDAIDKNILRKQSFLYDEPNFLLQREVTEVGSYFSIIKAIAAGNHKLNSIAGALGLKQTGFTKYLKTLIDLDILEREVPVTEENLAKSKKGLYKVTDNFVLFWFKFIFPNVSSIESGHSELALEKIKNNLVDNHISYVYEDICREEMWSMNRKGQWPFTFDRVGRWWKGDKKIDIVAFDSTGHDIIFGECKYWVGKVGINVLDALMQKAAAVNWNHADRNEHFVLFSINGFTDELIEVAAHRDNLVLCQ